MFIFTSHTLLCFRKQNVLVTRFLGFEICTKWHIAKYFQCIFCSCIYSSPSHLPNATYRKEVLRWQWNRKTNNLSLTTTSTSWKNPHIFLHRRLHGAILSCYTCTWNLPSMMCWSDCSACLGLWLTSHCSHASLIWKTNTLMLEKWCSSLVSLKLTAC